MPPAWRLLPLLSLAAGAGLQGWQKEEEPAVEEDWGEWAAQLDYYSDPAPAAVVVEGHGEFLEDYGDYQDVTAAGGAQAHQEDAWLADVSEEAGKEEDSDIEYFRYEDEYEAGNIAENVELDEEQNPLKQQNFMSNPGLDIKPVEGKDWFNFLSKPSQQKPITGGNVFEYPSDKSRPHKSIVSSKEKDQSVVGEKLETTAPPPENKKQAATTGDNRNGFNIFSKVLLQELYSIPQTMERARRQGQGRVLNRVSSFISVLTDFAASYNQLSGALGTPS
jgi:hypothetical protein